MAAKNKQTVPVQIGQIDPHTLTPGQKQAISAQLDQRADLKAKIIQQLAQLQSQKQTVKDMKSWPHAKQVTGMITNLSHMLHIVDSQINQLTQQLQSASQLSPAEQELIQFIQTHCGNYLTHVKKVKNWLYRGATGANQYIARSRDTRRPKDSSKSAQELFDDQLRVLGFTALRSNSIFATSDFYHAAQFGDQIYVIFPLDNHSTYTYTKHDDITLDSPEELINLDKVHKYVDALIKHLAKQRGTPNTWKGSDRTQLTKWIHVLESEGADYFTNTLKQVQSHIKSGNKFQIPPVFTNKTLKDFVDTKQFIKDFGPQKTKLDVAIKNGYEVLINGVYLALSAHMFGELLTKTFGVAVESE